MRGSFFLFLLIALMAACDPSTPASEDAESMAVAPATDTLRYPQENHLRNLRQLTFGGDNAEAYFSFDNQHLVFQSNFSDWGVECDQSVTMSITGALAVLYVL